jgi:hypothetical protein
VLGRSRYVRRAGPSHKEPEKTRVSPVTATATGRALCWERSGRWRIAAFLLGSINRGLDDVSTLKNATKIAILNKNSYAAIAGSRTVLVGEFWIGESSVFYCTAAVSSHHRNGQRQARAS